jgi:hypothetical protein
MLLFFKRINIPFSLVEIVSIVERNNDENIVEGIGKLDERSTENKNSLSEQNKKSNTLWHRRCQCC